MVSEGAFVTGLRTLMLVSVAVGPQAADAQEVVLPSTASESRHFEFVGSTAAESHALAGQFDEIFEVVVRRLGVSLEDKVKVTFGPPNPGPCRSRGWTMVPPPGTENDSLPLIVIFADENTDAKQIVAVLAHELGHVLQYLAVDGGRSIQSIFNEGFATWAAGPYWLEWQDATSFQAAVASYVAAGTYLPLRENDGFLDTLTEEAVARFGQDCLNRRDVIYAEWAAFIEYLVEEYGRAKLYSLFQTAPLVSDDDTRPYRQPNFPAVYGSSLEELEAAWLRKVAANDSGEPEIRLENVAGNVFVSTGTFTHAALSIGEDGVLLVDGVFSDVIEENGRILRRLTDRPLKFVVNTHCHSDHTSANAAYEDAALIIAHANVRKRLSTGTVVCPKAALPDITVDGELSIYFNGEEIRILSLPAGHTDSDVIVFFTKSNVAHVGDLFYQPVPFPDRSNGGRLLGLIDALTHAMQELPADVAVIPAHGPRVSMVELKRSHELLSQIAAFVEQGVRDGKTLEQLQNPNELADLRAVSGLANELDRLIEDVFLDVTRD